MVKTHPTHRMRYSDSSHYDEVCEDCGATDGRGHEHLLGGPCGMPEVTDFSDFKLKSFRGTETDVDAIRRVMDKKTMYKLAYGGGDENAGKWLEFATYLGQITYKPGWYIRTGIEPGRMWFQVGVTEEAEISFDPIAGEKVPWRGAKHYLSPHMCRNEIVSDAKHAIDRAEMHETNEWFRYKGKSIYNPHIDPDSLVEVARFAKNFNTRDNAMTMDDPA